MEKGREGSRHKKLLDSNAEQSIIELIDPVYLLGVVHSIERNLDNKKELFK